MSSHQPKRLKRLEYYSTSGLNGMMTWSFPLFRTPKVSHISCVDHSLLLLFFKTFVVFAKHNFPLFSFMHVSCTYLEIGWVLPYYSYSYTRCFI